jgi:hypothetical protein
MDVAGPLRIEALPGWEDVHDKDWHGMAFSESVRLACERGAGVLVPPARGDGFRLNGLFWRALAKGGHQGAVYIMDSVRESARTGTLAEFLQGS